ncbi:MAG: sulfate adenylyltransferase, partial [bacterium]
MGSYAPHGGLKEPVNRMVPEDKLENVLQDALKLKKYKISNSDLSTLNRFGDGGLSPLTGPMGEDEFNQVLEEEVIIRGGKKYAWTIPLSFPIAKEEAERLDKGEEIAIVSEEGKIVGILKVSDIFEFDKKKYNESVYQTTRTDHPGARIVNNDSRDYLLGGEVQVFPQEPNPSFGEYILSPVKTRELFKEKKWEKIVAFQTRNPLHRAH